MAKNIVICLDGTANEPEREHTNVARIFDIAKKDPFAPDRDPPTQVAYYDPGVGTMGARSATTRLGQFLTRVTGLVMGHGIKQNIAEAYEWLMNVYEKDDKIFIFGFSRGAYTARAVAGMLRTTGLAQRGATNLIPYALKLYTGAPRSNRKRDEAKSKRQKRKEGDYWDKVQKWENLFANPDFERFGKPVHFLGAWDTVKSVGWFNIIGRFRQAKWPFTRNLDPVVHGRHAVSLDERRRYYGAYLFDPNEVAHTSRHLREVWFAGVHSDVGGGYEDHDLADITLKWMIDEAFDQGLELRSGKYRKHLGVAFGDPLPPAKAGGKLHTNGFGWFIAGLGWRPRRAPNGSLVHASVRTRMADKGRDYEPNLGEVIYVDR